jgi:TolA-binding protein
MRFAFWLLLFAFAALAVWLVWHSRGKWQARKRAEEERVASFLAGNAAGATPKPAAPSPAPLPAAPAETAPAASNGLAQQKLLFEAAHKAGEAGEAALAIQLYGRLLARYPATAFAAQARAAVEAFKKKLVKA